MAQKPKLTKAETETLEMVRCLSGVPLSTIHTVLDSLAAVLSISYAKELNTSEDVDVDLAFPYIGTMRLKGDALLVDWSKHSVLLKNLVDAKRAVREGDSSLFNEWRGRLEADLLEKLV